jgi:hypothetical protein
VDQHQQNFAEFQGRTPFQSFPDNLIHYYRAAKMGLNRNIAGMRMDEMSSEISETTIREAIISTYHTLYN